MLHLNQLLIGALNPLFSMFRPILRIPPTRSDKIRKRNHPIPSFIYLYSH